MPSIGNYSAWIEVDKKRLPEYQIEYSRDGGQASCYVPSEVGKEFRVCYSDSLRAITTAASVTVDGSDKLCGRMVYSNQEKPEKKSTRVMSGAETGKLYRPFVFAACQLQIMLIYLENDDDASIPSASLGEINVHVKHVKFMGYKPPPSRDYRVDLPSLRIHEQAKKGVDHGVQYAPLTRVPLSLPHSPGLRLGSPKLRISKSAKVNDIQKLVTFTFKYRSLGKLIASEDVLTANGIVPKHEAKDTMKHKRHSEVEVIDLTMEEEEQSRNRPPIKREVKHEAPVGTGNEIIDLTI
ncbi:hypothetical protein D9613_007439 [Agrocybe pediades]|uniref:DUF7918 domain-containing protein n=1 Tax=Agrocybe pediades TaxID=84607 RepID=A0A8H4QMW3_9AGAR|nr:hypothetical protein D9613_007439 [Agrocybe pediades]